MNNEIVLEGITKNFETQAVGLAFFFIEKYDSVNLIRKNGARILLNRRYLGNCNKSMANLHK